MSEWAGEVARIGAGWDEAARQDPYFNILTVPGMTRAAFWESGEREVADLLVRLYGPPLVPVRLAGRRSAALDFGCGLGRLTQPLARWFEAAVGVDASVEMVRRAAELNRYSHCEYVCNPDPGLAVFADDSFDLVYSNIVLQHMPSGLAGVYVRDFVRVARPGAYVVFQLPEWDYSHSDHWLSMYGARRAEVESWLTESGAEIVSVDHDEAAGPGRVSNVYTARVPVPTKEQSPPMRPNR